MPHFLKNESGSVGVAAGTALCFMVAGVGFLFAVLPHANPLAEFPDAKPTSTGAPSAKTPKVIPVGPITDKSELPAAVAPAGKVSATPAEVEKRPPAPAPEPRPVAVTPPPPAPRKRAEPTPSPAAAEPVASERPASRQKAAPADGESAPAPRKGGTGFLTVDAMPWADVTVDSVSVDRTPIAELPLSAGSHTVEFNNDEIGVRVVRKVTISAGGSKTLKVNLETEAAKKAAADNADDNKGQQ